MAPKPEGMLDPTSDIDVLIVLQEPFNYSYETERISFIVASVSKKHNVVMPS